MAAEGVLKGTRARVGSGAAGVLTDQQVGTFAMEDSPSYAVLNESNLMTNRFRLESEGQLDLKHPNSSRESNLMSSCLCCPCQGWLIKQFEVQNGTIRLAEDGRGNYDFFGAGVHQVWDCFYTFKRKNMPYATGSIVHGDRCIVTVPQGYIGYCTDRGQPVLLPPGMHQWRSNTLKFSKMVDLNSHVICLGPWTLLTIDEGYMAVTQDNGRQVILDGGNTHLLTHRNWKFEKFVSTKIQTNQLERNEAASADNVIMMVDATVLWRISDVETAVRNSAETMAPDGRSRDASEDIVKLRNDVLKQAEASLAMFIGTINFSDTMATAFHVQGANNANSGPVAVASEAPVDGGSDSTQPSAPPTQAFNMYNNDKLDNAVTHANEITRTYGVEIISINIISAVPKDTKLQASLAAGAVAAAEAQMMETTAQGKSRSVQIAARAKAAETMIVARADADADVLRAEGSKQAGELLSANDVSVELAKIERTGAALAGSGNNASFFFGADPTAVSRLLANPAVVNANDRMGR